MKFSENIQWYSTPYEFKINPEVESTRGFIFTNFIEN